MSQHTLRKAERLRYGGKVRRVAADVFEVEGDHGTYTVVLVGDDGRCPCPSREADCSHVVAARWQRKGDEIAAEPMDNLWKRVGA